MGTVASKAGSASDLALDEAFGVRPDFLITEVDFFKDVINLFKKENIGTKATDSIKIEISTLLKIRIS